MEHSTSSTPRQRFITSRIICLGSLAECGQASNISHFSGSGLTYAAATALNCFAYNFIKIHRTLRTSPAMAAGVTDRLWSVEDLVALWEAYEQRREERAA